MMSSLDAKSYVGNTVEVFNYAYSKYQNNGGLFPHDHQKRGHLKSFKKLQTITGPNSPKGESSNQATARPKMELTFEDKAANFSRPKRYMPEV